MQTRLTDFAPLQKEVLKLRAENERLRAALSQIQLYTDKPECFEVADIAFAALSYDPPTTQKE
jgi:hypothetical protein